MTTTEQRQQHEDRDSDSSKVGLFFKALVGDSTEARCVECGAVEWVIPLDRPLDLPFLANYRCDRCDGAGIAEAGSGNC